MVKNIVLGILRWAPWAVAAVAGFITLQGLLGQAAIGTELTQAMAGVAGNVRAARELTARTADQLAPLGNTSATLREMNSRLTTTAADVREMNAAMGRLTDRQRTILTGLNSLNGHMGDLVKDLGTVDQKNKALLGATQNLARQTTGQINSLESLSDLTDDAIEHLHVINRRLGFLSKL